MTQQVNGDLYRCLQIWPELSPDAFAMQRTAELMNSRMAALRTVSENLGEQQFRLLLAACAGLAVIIYMAWQYIADFLIENPWCEFAILCVTILSLIAPLVLVPLLGAGRGEAFLPQSTRGQTTC